MDPDGQEDDLFVKVCALGRRPSAKREGDVAASAATSAEGRRLLITKRTHCSHLHFCGTFSGHKNGLIFG